MNSKELRENAVFAVFSSTTMALMAIVVLAAMMKVGWPDTAILMLAGAFLAALAGHNAGKALEFTLLYIKEVINPTNPEYEEEVG